MYDNFENARKFNLQTKTLHVDIKIATTILALTVLNFQYRKKVTKIIGNNLKIISSFSLEEIIKKNAAAFQFWNKHFVSKKT